MTELFRDVRGKQTKEETATVRFVITEMKTFTKTSCYNKFSWLTCDLEKKDASSSEDLKTEWAGEHVFSEEIKLLSFRTDTVQLSQNPHNQ